MHVDASPWGAGARARGRTAGSVDPDLDGVVAASAVGRRRGDVGRLDVAGAVGRPDLDRVACPASRPRRAPTGPRSPSRSAADRCSSARSPSSIETSTFETPAIRRPGDAGDRRRAGLDGGAVVRDVDPRLGEDRALASPSRAAPSSRRRLRGSSARSPSATSSPTRSRRGRGRSGGPGSRAPPAAAASFMPTAIIGSRRVHRPLGREAGREPVDGAPDDLRRRRLDAGHGEHVAEVDAGPLGVADEVAADVVATRTGSSRTARRAAASTSSCKSSVTGWSTMPLTVSVHVDASTLRDEERRVDPVELVVRDDDGGDARHVERLVRGEWRHGLRRLRDRDVSAAGAAEARLVVRERPSVPATTAPTATPALPMRNRRRSQSGMPDTVFAFRRGRSSSRAAELARPPAGHSARSLRRGSEPAGR